MSVHTITTHGRDTAGLIAGGDGSLANISINIPTPRLALYTYNGRAYAVSPRGLAT